MILSHNEKWIANRTLGGFYVFDKELLCKHILPYLYVFMCGTVNGRRKEELFERRGAEVWRCHGRVVVFDYMMLRKEIKMKK
jgi:hypothetical protein